MRQSNELLCPRVISTLSKRLEHFRKSYDKLVEEGKSTVNLCVSIAEIEIAIKILSKYRNVHDSTIDWIFDKETPSTTSHKV